MKCIDIPVYCEEGNIIAYVVNYISDMKYGLISETDGATLEKTIDLICNEFQNDVINVTEIGLYNGETTKGLQQYISSKKRNYFYTGIDNEKDKSVQELQLYYENLIIGNSNEVYNQLADNSQHLILIDGNHSFPYVISDYYCYSPKVKVGGYLCFHDIAPQAQGRDWQRMGSENDSDMFISVRKALAAIGLLNNEWIGQLGWTKVFEEWDIHDRCGGLIVFKKLF